MGRLGYRKVLPVIQLLAFALLIWYGCPYRSTWQSWLGHRDEAAWNLAFIDGPLSSAEQLALGLNAPASLCVSFLIPFQGDFRDGATAELAQHIATALGVSILWRRVRE